MPADCEASGDRLDESFLKVEISATHVARAIDQECNVSGNRDVGYACYARHEICIGFILAIYYISFLKKKKTDKRERKNTGFSTYYQVAALAWSDALALLSLTTKKHQTFRKNLRLSIHDRITG